MEVLQLPPRGSASGPDGRPDGPDPVDERALGAAPDPTTGAYLTGELVVPEGSPRRFVFWLLGAVLLAAGAVGAANWWLDPTGVTGRSTRFTTVENLEVRQIKLELMERAPRAPDVLVLGSSRSMMIDPATIERLAGQRAFNAAVSGASTYDTWLYAAYAAERWPNDYPHLVVGLVNDVFRDPVGGSPLDERTQELLGEDDRVELLPMLEQLLQVQTTRASVVAARREVRAGGSEVLLDPIGVPTPTGPATKAGEMRVADRPDQYRADGMQLFDPSIDLRRPLFGRVQHQMLQYIGASFAEGDEFDGVGDEGLDRFREMVRIANEHGDVPAIFITPFHPQAAEMLPEEYNERERRMRATLRRLQAGGLDFTLHEYDDIAEFGGDPDEFYDGIHMTRANTDRLVQRLHRDGALLAGAATEPLHQETPTATLARAAQLAEGGTVAAGR